MKVKLCTREVKNTLKILSKISGDTKVKVIENIVILTKWNSDTLLSMKLEGYSEKNGKLVLPEDSIDLIKRLKDDYFTLTGKFIQSGNKTIKLKNVQEDYTEESYNYELLFTTTERELYRLLEVRYAMAKDDVRPILKGVFFNGNETCALDGYRMSVRKGDYESSAAFVLNKNTAELLSSLLDSEAESEVLVYGDEKLENIRFAMRNREIIGKTLIGEFINYKSIIPDGYNYLATVNADKLKEELSFLNGIKINILKLNFTKNKLTLLTSQCKKVYDEKASRELTEALRKQAHERSKEEVVKPQRINSLVPISDIKIEVDCYTKLPSKDEDSFNIAVNPRYLIDGVKTYSDDVEFRMTSSVSPIVVTNDGYNLELILPVRFLN